MIRFARNLIAGLLAYAITFAPAYAGTSSTSAPASLTRTFTSSTTDIVPGWATGVYITEQGGGAGGISSGVNGGGSGATVYRFFSPVTAGATLTITVGAGGTAGNSGGSSSVTGSIITPPPAVGGAPNLNNPASTAYYDAGMTLTGAFPAGYYPPQKGTGNGPLSCGLYDMTTIAAVSSSGAGGCSFFGKGGAAGATNGNAGTGYGSGGGAGAAGTGGSGAGGRVDLTYVQ